MKKRSASAAGYSGTPLVKKLGIKAGFRVRTKHEPDNYRELIAPIPANVCLSNTIRSRVDLWHFFTGSEKELASTLPVAMGQINQDGMIWVSWPKKSSGIQSEITEDSIRSVALSLGLVDVKVCAVDETWSALKLVIRKELRK